MIPATAWNRVVDLLARSRILGVRRDDAAAFRHPWNVRPAYDQTQRRWTVQIHPGFINSADILAAVPATHAPPETIARLAADPDRPDSTLDALLTESPRVPIPPTRFRAVGYDASTPGADAEPVPAYFLARGVMPARTIRFDSDSLTLTEQDTSTARAIAARRQLRAVDLIVRYPRTHAALSVQTDDRGIPMLIVDFRPPTGPPRLDIVPRFIADPPVDPEIIALGDWTDSPHHTVHLATVWFLSPPGAIASAVPDAKWLPAISHHLFWNLNHAVRLPDPNIRDTPIVAPGKYLAGGIAADLLRTMEIDLNRTAAAAQLLAQKVTVDSRLWSI